MTMKDENQAPYNHYGPDAGLLYNWCRSGVTATPLKSMELCLHNTGVRSESGQWKVLPYFLASVSHIPFFFSLKKLLIIITVQAEMEAEGSRIFYFCTWCIVIYNYTDYFLLSLMR